MFAMDQLPEEILVPITSGAFARGIAETLDLLAIPAVFLDRGAHVLFANGAAEAVLNGRLQVKAHHLVAERKEDNRIVSDLIAKAMNDGDSQMRSAVLSRSKVTLYLLPVGDRFATSGQMVSAIALIDTGEDPGVAAIIRRMGATVSDGAAALAKRSENG